MTSHMYNTLYLAQKLTKLKLMSLALFTLLILSSNFYSTADTKLNVFLEGVFCLKGISSHSTEFPLLGETGGSLSYPKNCLVSPMSPTVLLPKNNDFVIFMKCLAILLKIPPTSRLLMKTLQYRL